MAHDEHWYDIVTADNLRQGDIIRALAIPYFDDEIVGMAGDIDAASKEGADAAPVPVQCARADWIVLDASCDVDHGDARRPAVSHVLLVRVVSADLAGLSAKTEKELKERCEALRQGLVYSKFLLAACPRLEPNFPLSLVEYRQRSLLPHGYVLAGATRSGPRLRLRSPIRERFGNWAGAAISRVGPEEVATIDPFVPTLHDAQKLRAVGALS